MATGNSSGLGPSLFRGALHGNTSNPSTSVSNNNQQQLLHSSNHQLQGPSHHQHLSQQQHSQHQQQQPGPPSQSQMSMGAAVFTPEQHLQPRSAPGSPDHMTTLMAKLWFDHNVESSLTTLKREEHDKRMRDLRKELDYIADTNWKYSPVEKYIGQQ